MSTILGCTHPEKRPGAKGVIVCALCGVATPAMQKHFARIGTEIGELVQEKNRAYGDSFAKTGEAFRLLYPSGIAPEQYDDALCLVRIWDKMMRIATAKDAFGESPYRDIAGYAILGAERVERWKGEG